jgi:two-component system OmpR family sensor kinase
VSAVRRFWPRLRSLRSRLLVGLLAVTAIGLVASNIVAVSALQSYLSQQVDQQLGVAVNAIPGILTADSRLTQPMPPDAADCSVVVTDAAGKQLARYGSANALAVPSLATLRELAAAGTAATLSVPGEFYRVRVVAISEQRFLVVSQSLKWSRDVLLRLVSIELVVTVLALILAAALAMWVSRYVLRPLDRMSASAATFADGELSHRVELAGSPTEVARLGESMNQMLTRVEVGFSERRTAEERLRQFIGDASHELRTPLTTITGYAQLYRQGALEDPAELADAMRRVEDEARRMSALVDELLLLARLDQGRPLEQARLDLAELALSAGMDARAAAPSRQLSVVIEPGDHVVVGDPDRLRQLVGNLLANVRAHTPQDAAAELRVGREDGDELIDVLDSGPGIDPAQRERVFERFFRADPTRQRLAGNGMGSGLGLSIVAAIAKAHGGTASVRPHDGGAWLRVRIPAAADSQPTLR